MIRDLLRPAAAGFTFGAGFAVVVILADHVAAVLEERDTLAVFRAVVTAQRTAAATAPLSADYDAVHQSARRITTEVATGLRGAAGAIAHKTATDLEGNTR